MPGAAAEGAAEPSEQRRETPASRKRVAIEKPPPPWAGVEKALRSIPSLLRSKVPAALVYGVAGALLSVLGAVAILLYLRIGDVPEYDASLDQRLAARRALKADAERLASAGQPEASIAKLRELQAGAPNAAWIGRRIKELERGLKADERERQRLELSRRKFDAAKALFDGGEYEQALALFGESFNLDPSNPNDPGRYIRLSGERSMIQRLAKLRGPVPTDGKAGILFRMKGPTNDGYVVVLLNGAQILRENLWEAGTGMAQQKVPRNVISYRNVDPGAAQVVVEIVIPAWKFRESRPLDVTTTAGNVYRVGVTLDRNTRRLDVALSE